MTKKIPKRGDDKAHSVLIGRDHLLQQLGAAIDGKDSILLVHGVEGVGKTAVARRFVQQLLESKVIAPDRVFWHSFEWDIRTADYVINDLGIGLLGVEFAIEPIETRIKILADTLRQNRCFIVWDGFEIVHGFDSVGQAKFRSEHEQHLHQLLQMLSGGQTRVLITSRSGEPWLETGRCVRLKLDGLTGEQRRDYCRWIIEDLNLDIGKDPHVTQLLALTDGHPMAMRIILAQLKTRAASELCSALELNTKSLVNLAKGTKGNLLTCLRLVEQSIPESSRPLLAPLALHKRFVAADDLEAMAIEHGIATTRRAVDAFLRILSDAGILSHAELLNSPKASIYEIHATLDALVQANDRGQSRERWQRAFVYVMANRADTLAVEHGQTLSVPFFVYAANYQAAMNLANTLHLDAQFSVLLTWLDSHMQNRWNLKEATRPLQRVSECITRQVDPAEEAATCRKLGAIAQHQRDFGAADNWYRKALELLSLRGDSYTIACTYIALGNAASAQNNIEAAEKRYQQAVELFTAHNNKSGTARTLLLLGATALQQQRLDAAAKWHRRSRTIFEDQGNEFGVAANDYGLARVAQEQREFDLAERLVQKSLLTCERLECHGSVSKSYYQLGRIAKAERRFDVAEKYCRKAIDVAERFGNDEDAVPAYVLLGSIAVGHRDLDAAEKWCQKPHSIAARRRDEIASATYHLLGTISQHRQEFDDAEKWYNMALEHDEERHDEDGASVTVNNLGALSRQRGDYKMAAKWLRRSLDIKLKRGNQSGAATTYHQMGRVAEEECDLSTARKWYRKEVEVKEQLGDELGAAKSYLFLGNVAYAQGDTDAAETSVRRSLDIYRRMGEEDDATMAYEALVRIVKERDESKGIWCSWTTRLFGRRDA